MTSGGNRYPAKAAEPGWIFGRTGDASSHQPRRTETFTLSATVHSDLLFSMVAGVGFETTTFGLRAEDQHSQPVPRRTVLCASELELLASD